MYKLGIDLGYGFTKGIVEGGRNSVVFPSVVGTGFERELGDMFGIGQTAAKYEVVVDDSRYFVGELAIKENLWATRAFEDERQRHYATPVLYVTAAALLIGSMDMPCYLGVGLPFELYKTQKQDLENMLKGMEREVEVLGYTPKRRIRIEDVVVTAQAAGAFYSCILDTQGRYTDLGKRLVKQGGLAGILDVGYKTTDFMIVDLNDMGIIETMSGSHNMGMIDVYRAVQRTLENRVHGVLDLFKVEEAAARGSLIYKNTTHDVRPIVEKAVEQLCETVADRLRITWGDQEKYLSVLFLAGGGAELLAPALSRRDLPVQALSQPQLSNAKGYLSLAMKSATRKS